MHAQAHKILTYYTVTGHETLYVYNDTEQQGPHVVTTSDGRMWRQRGVPMAPPSGFVVQPGELYLRAMTKGDAFDLANEIAEREWIVDPTLRRLYETQEDFRAVTVQGLMREVVEYGAPILAVHS